MGSAYSPARYRRRGLPVFYPTVLVSSLPPQVLPSPSFPEVTTSLDFPEMISLFTYLAHFSWVVYYLFLLIWRKKKLWCITSESLYLKINLLGNATYVEIGLASAIKTEHV